MIIKVFFACVVVVFGIFFIFCMTTHDRKSSHSWTQSESHLAQHPNDGNEEADAVTPFNPSDIYKPELKRHFRDLPVMNIPAGFWVVAVPVLLMLLVYIVGLILNDMSIENPENVEKLFGKLNK